MGPTQPKIEYIGAERAPLVTIDGYADDPAGLVDFAAAHCAFHPVAGNLYPGIRAPAPEDYVRDLVLRLEGLVREVFQMGDLQVRDCTCNFSLVTTTPDRLQLRQIVPHYDTVDVHQLAVLHYLCPAEHGGTSFYRHRATGYEVITADRCDRYVASLAAGLSSHGLPPRAYIDGDTTLFERIAKVDAAFNRLVIYRSANLHSGNIGRNFKFEQDVHNGRLTLNTFLQFGPHAPA